MISAAAGLSVEDYRKQQRTNFVYALTELEVILCTRVLDREITVVAPSYTRTYSATSEYDGFGRNNPIVIAYNGENHYHGTAPLTR